MLGSSGAICSGVSRTRTGGEDTRLGGVPGYSGAPWQYSQHLADVCTCGLNSIVIPVPKIRRKSNMGSCASTPVLY